MTTPQPARRGRGAKPDTLRYVGPDAVWDALPERDRNLLLWLIGGEYVTSELAALLVYGNVRIAQRRLARLREYDLVRGFWAAGANRARGRHVFELTSAARAELERLAWNGNPPLSRRGEPPTSGPIHQLATHDVFAAFLRAGRRGASDGLVAWIPERACRNVFDGFVRPDAIAALRIAGRVMVVCIERDLGTERSEVLTAKIRRYRALSRRRVNGGPLTVAFVVDTRRRARTVLDLNAADRVRANDVRIVTARLKDIADDPLGAPWLNDQAPVDLGGSARLGADARQPVLAPGCLLDADTLVVLDDRAVGLLMPRNSYIGA